MLFRVFSVLIISLLVATTYSSSVFAANKGLAISPDRQEIEVKAGTPTKGSFWVENKSKNPITVNLYVQKFSAVDYSYELRIRKSDVNWIQFETPQLQLMPGKGARANFVVDVPKIATPGGHYFALTAYADFGGSNIKLTGEIISQLYLNIDDKLIRKGTIHNPKVPFIVFDKELSYTYDVRNSGNTHLVATFYGTLNGLFVDQSSKNHVTHILLPGTIRSLGGSVKMPFLPGMYTLTYGYSGESLPNAHERTAYILYVPPWSIMSLVLALMITQMVWQKRRARRSESKSSQKS